VICTGAALGAGSTSLGHRLRSETRAAHDRAEAAFDLPRRVASPQAYADVLVVLESFHRRWAAQLQVVAPSLPASLRDGPARRRSRLRADLSRLGRAPAVTPSAPPTGRDPHDPDGALGAWYVLEGAALGGLVIAAEVRRRLPEVAPATTFFAGDGRDTAARWRAFGLVLREWEVRGEAAAARVIDGALATFAALTEPLAAGR
jgi:heme oxygenase (biliverdin-IX-beta and delta-forming)